MSPEAKLAEIAGPQFGIFTRDQAAMAGFPFATINHRLRTGMWARVFPGVYRSATTRQTSFNTHVAAQLACAPQARVSHRSAAFLLGWLEQPKCPEITVPYGNRPKQPHGVRMHRSRIYHRAFEFERGPLRVTSPTDTLFDLAEVSSAQELQSAVDAAVGSQSVRLDALAYRYSAYRGRRGRRRLISVVEALPRDIENHDSVLETEFARLMDRAGIDGFEHHMRIETDAGAFEADFAWPDAAYVVETDGRVHDYPDQKSFDSRRDAAFDRAGWQVRRFRWFQVTRRPGDVIATVRQDLRL